MESGPISRKLMLFSAVAFVLVVGVVGLAYGYTRSTASYAETLLESVQAVHLNASLDDARRFMDGHAGVKEVKCTDQQRSECELVIRLDNRWLAKLHLAPPTTFAVGFTCSRGRIIRMEASIGVHRQIPGTYESIYAAEVIEDVFDSQLGREPFYRVHKLANNSPGRFIPLLSQQILDERATPSRRKLAYSSLNVSCLSRFKGCQDAEALAPSAWTAADKAGWHDETSTQEPH